MRDKAYAPIVMVLGVLSAAAAAKLGPELRKLMDRLEDRLVQSKSNSSVTTQGKAMEALGQLAAQLPDLFGQPHATALANRADAHLQLQLAHLNAHSVALDQQAGSPQSAPTGRVKTEKVEWKLIEGAFRALNGLLVHFAPQVPPKTMGCVSKGIMTVLDPKTRKHHRPIGGPIAALQLLARHPECFHGAIWSYHQALWRSLLALAADKNDAIRSAANDARDAIARVLSDAIVKCIRDAAPPGAAEARKVFDFLWRAVMGSAARTLPAAVADAPAEPEAPGTQRAGATTVRVLGYLAEPCRLLSGDAAEKLLPRLIERIQGSIATTYAEGYGAASWQDQQDLCLRLPAFLRAQASLVGREGEASTTADAAQRGFGLLTGRLLEFWTDSTMRYARRRRDAIQAVAGVCERLWRMGGGLEPFFHTCAKQALLCVCSQPHSIASESDDAQRRLLYRDFFVAVFEATAHLEPQAGGATPAAHTGAHATMYAAFVKALREVMQRLNIDAAETTDAEPGGAHVQFRPANPHDHHIFVILVEFCGELIPALPPVLLCPWATTLIPEAIDSVSSSARRRVGGLYRLISTFVSTLGAAGFFDGRAGATEAVGDRVGLIELLWRCVIDVQGRMRHYKDELLAACTAFVLHLPVAVIRRDVDRAVVALQTALRLGIGYAPLAHIGFEVFEEWLALLPRADLDPHLLGLVRLLGDYLQVDAAGAIAVGGSAPLGIWATKLLGKAGAASAAVLAAPSLEAGVRPPWVALDYKKHLLFELPFATVNASVFLDDLLPRTIALALGSSDRPSKVAACELLHTLVIFVIGTSATERVPAALYREICPAVLRLACDVEDVAQQLFAPLVQQLLRWFGRPATRLVQGDAVDTLLDAVMDGIADAESPDLRAFCGQCIATFFEWTVKQTSDEELEDNPENLMALFYRIFALTGHSGTHERIGAARIVNLIYRTLREHGALVDRFALELLVELLDSLKYSAGFDDDGLVIEETDRAVDRVLRIVADSKAGFFKVLQASSPNRRVPRALAAHAPECEATVATVVNWSLGRTGATQPALRRACWRVICAIAGLTGDAHATSPVAWARSRLVSVGVAAFVAPLDAAAPDAADGGVAPREPWSRQEATVDGYVCLISKLQLRPAEVFGAPDARPIGVLRDIMAEQALMAAGDAGAVVAHDSFLGTAAAVSQRCRSLVAAMQLLTLLYRDGDAQLTDRLALAVGPTLPCVLATAILRPTDLGFGEADLTTEKALSDTVHHLAQAIVGSDSPQHRALRDSLGAAAAEMLGSDGDGLLALFKRAVAAVEPPPPQCTSLTAGMATLGHCGLLPGADELARALVAAAGEAACSRAAGVPEVMLLADRLIRLALFYLAVDPTAVTSYLARTGTVGTAGAASGAAQSLSLGEHFYRAYASPVSRFLAEHGSTCVGTLAAEYHMAGNGEALRGLFEAAAASRSLKTLPALQSLWGFTNAMILSASTSNAAADVYRTLHTALGGLAPGELCTFFRDCALGSTEPFVARYSALLLSAKLPWATRGRLAEMLPVFCAAPDDVRETVLSGRQAVAMRFVEAICATHEGANDGGDRRPALRGLIKAMLTAGAEWGTFAPVVEAVRLGSASGQHHSFRTELEAALAQLAERGARGIDDLLERSFAAYLAHGDAGEGQMSPSEPWHGEAIAKRVLCVMLGRAPQHTVLVFFTRTIGRIMTVLFDTGGQASLRRLLQQCGAFLLLETMFSRLGPGRIKGERAEVEHAFAAAHTGTPHIEAGKFNNLLRVLIKLNGDGSLYTAAFGPVPAPSGSRAEVLRFRSAAYVALVALLRCALGHQPVDFSKKLCLKLIKPGFGTLVDLDRVYEFDEATAFQRTVVAGGGGGRKAPVRGRQGKQSVFMESQLIAMSSLAEGEGGADEAPAPDESDEDEGVPAAAPEFQIDVDPLNRHDIMVPLTAAVQLAGAPEAPEGAAVPRDSASQPMWMQQLRSHMVQSNQHVNVRLLIARLVLNCSRVFAPWCKLWYEPLLGLVIDRIRNQGWGLNSFVMDVIFLLIEWAETSLPDETSQRLYLRPFLENLIQGTQARESKALEARIKAVRDLLALWKPIVGGHVPYPALHAAFTRVPPDRVESRGAAIAGVQLLGIVACNELLPYAASPLAPQLTAEVYWAGLVRHNLQAKSTSVYKLAASCIGSCMRSLALHGHDPAPLCRAAAAALDDALGHDDRTRYIACAHNICAAIDGMEQCLAAFATDGLVKRFASSLAKVHGDYRAMVLRVLLWRHAAVPDLLQHMGGRTGLEGLLCKLDPVVQSLTLELMQATCGSASAQRVITKRLVELCATTFAQHTHASCRAQFYKLLARLAKEASLAREVRDAALRLFLAGVGDADPTVRADTFKAVCDDLRRTGAVGPTAPAEQLAYALGKFQRAGIEEHALAVTAQIVLDLCRDSPNYASGKLFHRPLQQCTYVPVDIDVSAQRKNARMTPFFSASQAELGLADGNDDGQFVRATQELGNGRFSLTQAVSAASSGDAYDASYVASQDLSMTQGIFSRKRGREGAAPPPPRSSSGGGRGSLRSKRAAAEEGDGGGRRAGRARRGPRPATEVQLRRSYRDGELPDIEVKTSDLLESLKGLVALDANIAAVAFRLLFKALYAVVEREEGKEGAVHAAVHAVLIDMCHSSAARPYAPLVSCLHEVCAGIGLALDPGDVVARAEPCRTHYSAITLLETTLPKGEAAAVEAPPPGKRARGGTSNDGWVALARMFRGLCEYDAMAGILDVRGGDQGGSVHVRTALRCEALGDIEGAASHYDMALRQLGASDVERAFWQESRADCLVRLCRWKTIADSQAGGDAIWEPHNFPALQRWVLGLGNLHVLWAEGAEKSAAARLCSAVPMEKLGSAVHTEALEQLISAGAASPARRAVLEGPLAQAMSMFMCRRGLEDHSRFDSARFYANKSYEAIVSEWGELHPLMSIGRGALMQRVQPIVELDEFLQLEQANSRQQADAEFVAAAERTLRRWLSRTPSTVAVPVSIWDALATGRQMYAAWAAAELEGRTGGEVALQLCSELRLTSLLAVAEAAGAQGAYDVGHEYLKWAKNAVEADELAVEGGALAHLRHAYLLALAKFCHRKASVPGISIAKRRKNAVAGLKSLTGLLSLQQGGGMREQHEASALFAEGVRLLAAVGHMDKYADVVRQQFTAVGVDLGGGDVDRHALNRGAMQLLTRMVASPTEVASADADSRARAHMALAQLAGDERVAAADAGVRERLMKVEVTHTMAALALGHDAARLAFPQLLPLVDELPGLVQVLSDQAVEAPSWVFIMWIPQLLAVLDRPSGACTFPILRRIAGDYPGALAFPLLVSRDGLRERLPPGDGRVAELERLVLSKEMIGFARGLEHLESPHRHLLDWLHSPSLTYAVKLHDVKERRRLLREQYAALQPFLDGTPGEGEVWRRYRDLTHEDIKAALGAADPELGYPRVLDNGKALGAARGKLVTAAKDRWGKLARGRLRQALGQLVTWSRQLADYGEGAPGRNRMEMPGQYCGTRKPAPERHITVAGLGDEVVTLSSIRCPKVVTVRGSDERRHKFLVKCGEDLRCDQRVQQLFGLMNSLFRRDAACAQRRISVRTYQVVPVTSRTGLIEWVDNTRTLKEMIYEVGPTDEQRVLIRGGTLARARKAQQDWFLRLAAEGNTLAIDDAVLLGQGGGEGRVSHAEHVALCTALQVERLRTQGLPELKKQLAAVLVPLRKGQGVTVSWLPGGRVEPYQPVVLLGKPVTLQWLARLAVVHKGEALESHGDCARVGGRLQELARGGCGGLVPSTDLLRNALVKMAASAEAHVALREAFGRSLSAASICQHVMGVGDRHLSNTLIDTVSGEFVGIDFGMAFSVGVLNLPVPEVVPEGLRLSPQVVRAFHPYGTDGTIRRTMAAALGALQAHRDVVFGAMRIFVTEPLLDWEENVKRTAAADGVAMDGGGVDRYAAAMLDTVRLKLELGNPTKTLSKLLLARGAGIPKAGAIRALVRAVEGDRGVHPRAERTGDKCADVLEQVDTLIEMATDPNLLARVFGGWEAWL